MRFQTFFKDSTNSNKRWMDGHAMVNENGRPIFEEKKAAKQRPANDDKEGGRVDETTAPCVHISGWLHRRGRRCNHLDDEIWMIVFSRHRWLNLRSLPPAAIMLQIDRLYGYRYWLAHPLDNPLSRIHFFTALLSAKSTSFTLVTMDPIPLLHFNFSPLLFCRFLYRFASTYVFLFPDYNSFIGGKKEERLKNWSDDNVTSSFYSNIRFSIELASIRLINV